MLPAQYATPAANEGVIGASWLLFKDLASWPAGSSMREDGLLDAADARGARTSCADRKIGFSTGWLGFSLHLRMRMAKSALCA